MNTHDGQDGYMNILTFQAQLSAVNQRLKGYQKHYLQADEQVEREHPELRGADASDPARLEERDRLVKKAIGNPPTEEVFHFLDEACDFYLAALPTQREQMRYILNASYGPALLLLMKKPLSAREWSYRPLFEACYHYGFRAAQKLQEGADLLWLRRGLASVSLEETRIDFRDSLLILRELYLTAIAQGIDPDPSFRPLRRYRARAAPARRRVRPATSSEASSAAPFSSPMWRPCSDTTITDYDQPLFKQGLFINWHIIPGIK
jgi:hypothetical protein